MKLIISNSHIDVDQSLIPTSIGKVHVMPPKNDFGKIGSSSIIAFVSV